MGAKLDLKKFRKIASKSIDIEKAVSKTFEKQINLRQQKMLKSFDEHPVTQEIEAGNGATNTSGLLGGYGNLFTFIGFNEGSDPIALVRNYLNKKLSYKKTKASVSQDGFKIYYQVEIPGIKEITSITQLSHLGRSWITGVEQGKIDGFQYYLNRSRRMRDSRSGKGIQIDKKLRNSSIKPTAYVDKMLKDFRKSLEEIK